MSVDDASTLFAPFAVQARKWKSASRAVGSRLPRLAGNRSELGLAHDSCKSLELGQVVHYAARNHSAIDSDSHGEWSARNPPVSEEMIEISSRIRAEARRVFRLRRGAIADDYW